MKRIAQVLWLGLLVLLGACGDTVGYTGPEVNVGPVTVSLTLDSKGNVVLGGSYTQRLVGTESLGVGWTVGVSTVLRRAQQSPNQLFIVWEDENGAVQVKQYDIRKPFKVTFSSDEWVREIKHETNGSIVVAVEIRPENRTVSQNDPIVVSQPTRVSRQSSSPSSDSNSSATTSCRIDVDGRFRGLQGVDWAALGCPTAGAAAVWMAKEGFEQGQMLWREDRQEIYVRYNSGSWASFDDTWREGQPEYSCPDRGSASPPVPKRGFSKVWCNNSRVRDGLGWAKNEEQGFNGTIQDFSGGHIIATDTGKIIVLYSSGKWVDR